MTEPIPAEISLSQVRPVPGTVSVTASVQGVVPGGGTENGGALPGVPGTGPGELEFRVTWDDSAPTITELVTIDPLAQAALDLFGVWRLPVAHAYRHPGTYVISVEYLTLTATADPVAVGTPPVTPVFVPSWLAPSDVADWLSRAGDSIGSPDSDRITRVCCQVELEVQRARADCWVTLEGTEPIYVPDAEVYQAAVMLAARVTRRRNSPGGLESFADSIMYVSRYDPDIQRALRSGPFQPARVG